MSACSPISFECTEKILEQMKHSICYLCYNELSDNGFFCKIPYKGKLLKTLIVCNHSINEEVITLNDITLNDIKISFNNQKYTLELHGGTDRIIYSSKEYDELL